MATAEERWEEGRFDRWCEARGLDPLDVARCDHCECSLSTCTCPD